MAQWLGTPRDLLFWTKKLNFLVDGREYISIYLISQQHLVNILFFIYIFIFFVGEVDFDFVLVVLVWSVFYAIL